MKRFIKISVLSILTSALYIGCSDVDFNDVPQSKFFPNCVQKKEYGDRCSYSGKADLGKIDILFVDDNSGSMSTEQNKMADKFNYFIETLEGDNADKSKLDYHIAITTTHISGTLANGAVIPFQSYGDGNLIPFPNGAKVLKSESSLTKEEKVSYFKETIKRPETIACEDNNYDVDFCPSGDERGIYAINKVLDTADMDFFRPESHFAVVILSDEDVRSTGGSRGEIEDADKPSTLVSRLKDSLGPAKSMSIHAIIVPPGNTSCKQEQDNQGNGAVFGYYGYHYEQLANPSSDLKARGNIAPGTVGNICAKEYTTELRDIAKNLTKPPIFLPCAPVADDVAASEGFSAVSINVSPDPGYPVSFSVDTNNQVTFTPSLKATFDIHWEVVCKRK